MTNSLLDFVMSLVRDPDVAARYAADPAAAIAHANLSGVTSADVNGLIPMVTDSVNPLGTGVSAGDGNVWTSGAAAAAFDAFDSVDAHLPVQVVRAAEAAITVPNYSSTDLDRMDIGFGDSHVGTAITIPAVPSVEHLGELNPGYEQIDPGVAEWVEDHNFGVEHSGFDLF